MVLPTKITLPDALIISGSVANYGDSADWADQ